VGPAAEAIHSVLSSCDTGIKVGGRGHRKMPARRESHDSDARRVQTPVCSMRSESANRPLRVAQFDWMMISRTQPVAQYECRNAERVQIVCHLAFLMIHRKLHIAA